MSKKKKYDYKKSKKKKHSYEDGGTSYDDKNEKLRDAKKNALKKLKSKMSEMGGDSLYSQLKDGGMAYRDGGPVKASVIAKDEEGLKEGLEAASKMMEGYKDDDSDYSEYSRDELIEKLKKYRD